MSPDERFWAKVDKTASCWLWRASSANGGYGQFFVGGVRWRAHRYSYTRCVGEIPEGMELDHLCGVPACVNPSHLEAVTKAENLDRRNHSPRFHGRQAIECVNGHLFDEANTYITPQGRRGCRACIRERARRRYWRLKRREEA